MIYIGKDVNNCSNYFGSGVYYRRAEKKYGKKNFKKYIIDYDERSDSLDEKEKFWIRFYDSINREKGYNIASGGEGNTGKRCSEETRQKIRLSLTGNKNAKGYIRSKETREKISVRMTGNKNGAGNKGKQLSEETKRKISESMLAR